MSDLQKNHFMKAIILIVLICGAGFCIFMLFYTSGSSSNTKDDNTASSSDTPDSKIINNTVMTDGISYDVFYLNDNSAKPVAIIQHGLTGNRKDCTSIGKELAAQGFYVICSDAYGHGNTQSEKVLSVPEIVLETSKNIDTILNHIRTDKQVNMNQIYFAGFSLGALTAYHYGAYGNYKLTAIAACCGTPDFTDLIGNDLAYKRFSYGDWETIQDSEVIARIDNFITTNNPFNHIDNLYDIHILMQIAEKDTTIPPTGSYKLYNNITQDTANTLIPTLTTYPSQEHEVTEENLKEIIQYFIDVKNQSE